MSDNILLKKNPTGAWVYDSINNQYTLSLDGNVVAIIDSNGNMKITGRVLKIS